MNAGDRGLADELQLRADPRPRTPAISRALTRRVLLAMIKRRAAPPGFPPLTCCLAPPLGGRRSAAPSENLGQHAVRGGDAVPRGRSGSRS